MANERKPTPPLPNRPKRAYLPQTDVPGCTLDDALRVPRAIAENYGFKPATPLNVAAALEMQPNAGRFRLLTGAAIAYGVTDGGPNAAEIAITPLGLRIVRPTKEGDDLAARREALLRPRVVGEFLQKYGGAQLPRADIGVNVLLEMGVPKERADDVLDVILQGAESVGLLQEIKGKKYVSLSGARSASDTTANDEGDVRAAVLEAPAKGDHPVSPAAGSGAVTTAPRAVVSSGAGQPQDRRVFITHGKNKALIEPIKKLLGFGELEAFVSVEKTSVSQPVPAKVMGEMRRCGAAIIHVDAEQKWLDKDGNEVVVINPNVLIEIGAAMALFGQRFILLVKDGLKLPSNLQGLFEVRYSGDALDGDATIKLLEAINDIKNHAMPDRYSPEVPAEPRSA